MKPIITSVAFAILLTPILIFAQVTETTGIVPCNGPDCQTCDVIKLGQNLLDWFIYIMATVITLIFAIGGLRMVTAGGNEANVTTARTMMTNAVVGFVILLSAWLLVDTVMKTFVKDSYLGPWNEIECLDQPNREHVPDVGGGTDNDDGTGGGDGDGGTGGYGPIIEPDPVVGLSGSTRSWNSVFQGIDWPLPKYTNEYVKIPRGGYIAIRFNTGSVRDSGGVITAANTSSNGVRLGAISKVAGNFNVNNECKHAWGSSGGIGWTTENKAGYCRLLPDTTYYLNLTFTDGFSAGSDRCLPSEICATTIQPVNLD